MVQRLKHLPAMWETWVWSLGWEDPLEKEMATHTSILAWRIPWTEELGGLQSTGRKESDTTERLHFLFSMYIGEGNGNPLQCSCLENPRDGEAWSAAVYGVAQSRTRLKWLSSSSSSGYEVAYQCGVDDILFVKNVIWFAFSRLLSFIINI